MTNGNGGIEAMLHSDLGKMKEDVKAYQKSFTMMQDNFAMTKKLLGDLQTWDNAAEMNESNLKNLLKDISVSVFVISQQEKAKDRLKEKLGNINRADEISTEVFKNRNEVFYSNLSVVMAIVAIMIITLVVAK